MAQRYDIVRITFQANARNANAAVESMRKECERCQVQYDKLKADLKQAINANLPADQIDTFRKRLKEQGRELKQFTGAYKELIKGMRALDQGIKAFNDGTLGQQSAAFLKTVMRSADLTISKLSKTPGLAKKYKQDRMELAALRDAAQQFYARYQADVQQVISTISKGGKVSRNAIETELQQQKELLSVLAETDKGYAKTAKTVAVLEHYLKAMGGSYAEIRQNITDTKKVSDETLRNMYKELSQTNNEGKVTQRVMRENAKAMREIRAEQARRVQNVLGGDLGKQSEGAIRNAIASAKELMQVYGTSSKKAQVLAQQIVNAESYLKTVGVEGARAAKQQADAQQLAADKLKLMQDRMGNLNKLSQAGLSETQKYWQAQLDGATKGSRAYREAERNLKAINAEQQKAASQQLRQQANRLGTRNLGTLSEQEIQQSINAAKQLAASMKPTDLQYKVLVDDIMRAEEHLKKFGLEGQRSAKLVAEQMKLMTDRMSNLGTLSDGALEETRKFWESQMNGAERGSAAYKTAEANMKAVVEQQQKLATAQNKTTANTLLGGSTALAGRSEGEIRKAIEAAREYQKTIAADSQEYRNLSQAIVNAEEYVKKFGVDAERSAKLVAEQMKLMTDRMANLGTLSDGALAETRKFWEAQMNGAERGSAAYMTAEANMKAVVEQQQKLATAQNKATANTLLGGPTALAGRSEGEIRKAIEAAREYLKTLAYGSAEYNRVSAAVFKAEEYTKQYGIAAKQAKLQEEQLKATMEARLNTLKTLSQAGLAETQKYWQAQIEGAARGSAEYQQAEKALAKVNEQIKIRNASAAMRTLAKPGNYGDAEIRNAITAMEKLRDEQAHGSQEWEKYNRYVQQGKKYLDEWANADSVMKFEAQMKNLTTLSDNALAETKKFWQSMVDGTEKGNTALAGYEAQLKKVKQEESERRQLQNEMAVQKLGGNLSQLSEGEIRQAIEAGKQLIQTYETGSQDAQDLAKKIVNAEEHLKKYGLEAERSAQRERDAVQKAADARAKNDKLMQDQLQRGTALTASALKAQEQYWQRLINDPKTASSSLAQYEANLLKVQMLQKQMVADNGNNALKFFRNGVGDASAEQIKQAADALKKWRDMLPSQTQANLIAEIDGYLRQAGQSAGKAAQQAMSLKEAFTIGLQGHYGKSSHYGAFQGTTEQLKQARQVLEQTLATTEKGTNRFEQLRRALDGIALEEKRVGGVTQQMQAILDKPKGRSFNELKLAVEEGRKALNNIDRTTKQGQADFDELAKKIKAADFEMKTLAGTAKGSATAFEKAWSRLKTYITLYMGTAVAIQKLVATMGDLMTLSDKMGEVRKTTGLTADQVGNLTDKLAKLDVRTSITQLEALASTAGTLGLKTEEDIYGFTEAANKMMIALPEMGEDAAMQLMRVAMATGEVDKIRKQLQDGTVQGSSATAVAMEKIASTIDRLRASSAATAPEITDFVKRVGAVGAQSGITVDQVAALGSTVSSLGMGVEMAGTALSRMIPAIKNNAFSIAQILGVTPDTIRELFEAGRGMEVILMIFQKMHDQNMNADSIEKLLGTGGMQDIMKELNQQGARAGIVFAGLSQNVDQLRAALGTAKQAYEENTAIQQEFDRMNETTAAKWARLKNQVEEAFVSAANSNSMGKVVDFLRWIVDFITGNLSPALNELSMLVRSFAVAWAVARVGIGGAIMSMLKWVTHLGAGIRALTISFKKFYAANQANVWFAIAAGVWYLISALKSAREEAQKFQRELAELDDEEAAAERDVNRLTTAFVQSGKNVEEAKKKQEALEAQTKTLRGEVDTLKKSTDKSSEATAKLNAKQAELKKKEEELKKATDNSNKANTERSKLISEINSKYSKYLGYMLSEISTAQQVASAHWQIVDALKAENEEKHLAKEKEQIDEETSEGIKKAGGNVRASLSTLPSDIRERIISRMNTIRGAITTSVGQDGKRTYTLPVIPGLGNKQATASTFEGLPLYNLWSRVVTQEIGNAKVNLGTHKGVTTPTKRGEEPEVVDVPNTVAQFVKQTFGNVNKWMRKTMERDERYDQAERESQSYIEGTNASSIQHANEANTTNYQDLRNRLKGVSKGKDLTGDQVTLLAQDVSAIVANLNKFKNQLDNATTYVGKGNEATLQNAVNTMLSGLTQKQRDQVLAAAQRTQNGFANGGGGGYNPTPYSPEPTNPWGENPDAASTDWSKFNAKELVARRKQMNEFVKALQEDTDVQSVLAEDPALKKAIEKGMSSDMRTVINWYNTERLKIQDELHARFLTNTGNWKDPSNKHAAKKAQKMVNDEIKYYLDELDAYYTERKARIEQAQADGDIDEAEAWRRTLQNDQEWQQRRGELQQLYTEKREGVAKSEADAIYAILDSRTGEGVEAVQQNIASTIRFIQQIGKEKGLPAMKRVLGDLEKAMEQSFQKSQSAVAKQMAAIAEIISKERPFDGIVQNLRQNTEKMGVIQTDFEKRRAELLKAATVDQDAINALDDEQAREVNNRLTFMLQEAEHAYSMTWEKFYADALKDGRFGSWMDALLTGTPEDVAKRKEAILAQLRTTYDSVQDAIKKESSLVKKQVENQWNDAIIPGLDGKNISMKATYERASSALGIEEGRVSRANSLIGAGAMSERVADKLAIKQMQVQLNMQTHYYNLMRQIGLERVAQLRAQEQQLRNAGKINEAEQKRLDAEHAETSLNLSLAEEESALAKQREDIIARTEESENRLYTSLKDWASLLTSSLQSVFEASNTGLGDYYNNLAKMQLTGEGAEGGTYVVIDNAGTKDAEAHYEQLDGEEALRRQLEIEQQNAVADAWKKVMDDINQKISDTITDWVNSQLQNAAIDKNTNALIANTEALYATRPRQDVSMPEISGESWNMKTDENGNTIYPLQPTSTDSTPDWQLSDEDLQAKTEKTKEAIGEVWTAYKDYGIAAETEKADALSELPNYTPPTYSLSEDTIEMTGEKEMTLAQQKIDASNAATQVQLANQQKVKQGETQTDKSMTKTSNNMYAAMISAANLYGAAYSAVTNDNLSASQKFEMIALQAAGQSAMAMMTADMFKSETGALVSLPQILAECLKINPIAGAAIFAVLSALIGASIGLAMSKLQKGKSEVAQVTGASASAGRLSTGMLTYAEGNVNEFTDPSSLTPGKSYNVDAADGRTYRAKYTGNNPRTHITNGPEFHLAGERGREAIIDAHTTRLLQMDDTGIWKSIQTLYGGGLPALRRSRRGRGVRAFASGNLDELDDAVASMDTEGMDDSGTGMTADMVASLQASLDRNSEVMERAVTNGIKGVFNVYGKDGLVDSYDRGKKTLNRHGERY